ncbi:MAG TPA: GWxTD domain-containing protein [Gemmatimonadales bacterium]|nr:GWxTD domain-containing protein [Gemmatimonadales bacterium]
MPFGIAPGARRILPACGLALLAACGSWTRVGTETTPKPAQSVTSMLDENGMFRRIGRLASTGTIAFIGNVALLPAGGDSVLAVLALSLENRAFSFERQGDQGFTARYHVDLAFIRDSAPPVTIGRDQTVRVTTFQETLRNDESVLFQEPVVLAPGRYHLTVTVRDRRGDGQGRAEEDLAVSAFRPGQVTAPILVYEVTGRGQPTDPFRGILDPRGAAAYATDTLTALVEGYRMPAGSTVPLAVVDAADSVLLRQDLQFSGDTPVEARLLRFLPANAPLGELKFALGDGGALGETKALVSLSSSWIVSNYDEMLALLRYFGHEEQINVLRHAAPADRPALWQRFFKDSDPNPATPENEALDAYFARLATADQRYTDEGEPGWRTDRGEVYVTLGDPDEVIDASAVNQGRIVRWTYNADRLVLFFVDETGFGHFRLTPQSRADFERVRARHARAENH